MRLLDAHSKLLALGSPVILTTDAAACLGIAPPHANKVLTRLAASRQIVHLSRGRWAMSAKMDVLAVPPHLTAPFPSYVSLQTALYYHGMISQIPSVTYAVSLARTKRHATPFGTVSVHHVQPAFFFGFETRNGVQMATPEKALIDLLYLGPARSRLFGKLPELELGARFGRKKARAIIQRIPSIWRKTMVAARFDELLDT